MMAMSFVFLLGLIGVPAFLVGVGIVAYLVYREYQWKGVAIFVAAVLVACALLAAVPFALVSLRML